MILLLGKWKTTQKNNRRWTDRTTNARRGLRGRAYWQDSQNIVTAVMHSVNYGVWLELAHNKKYAILEESVRANIEETHGRRTMFSAGISGYIFFIITKIIGREKIRHMLIIE